MRPELNVDKALAMVKPRVKGVAMGKAARAIAPTASSQADSRGEERDQGVEVMFVKVPRSHRVVMGTRFGDLDAVIPPPLLPPHRC